jgi:serpin B
VEVGLADESESGGPRVSYACGVWHDERLALKPAYRAAAVETYQAETRAADFQRQVSPGFDIYYFGLTISEIS